jgi:HK97 family phage portal protein
LLADTISSLPTQLRDGPQVATSKVLKPSPLLTRPYAEISRRDWWVQFIWSLALRGNFFGLIIERDRLGDPVQIKPISPDRVQLRRLPGSGILEYRFNGLVVPLDDVVHVRYQTHPGSLIGLNPIEICALSFGLQIAQESYAETFFSNSANPQGVIQVPGVLDVVETKKMMRGWIAAHQGLNQANLPAILTEGAEFKAITINPSDSQLLEALGASRSLIAGTIFRIPLHMVGIVDRSSSWGRGLEVMERGFFSNTLIGYLVPAVEMMTGYHPTGQFMHFDTKERLRGTALERAQTGSLAMLAGAWCADDFRATFDQPPLPDGKGQYTYAPINTELLLQALQLLKDSETTPEPPEPEGDQSIPTPSGGAPAAGRSSNGHGRMSRDQAAALVRSVIGG